MKRRVNVKAFAGLFVCILLIAAVVKHINKKPDNDKKTEPVQTSETTQSFIDTAGSVNTGNSLQTGSGTSGSKAVIGQDGAAYVNGIMIVNKTYGLPENFNPGQLDDTVQSAFNRMSSDAHQENLSLWISSAFRSYDDQKTLYDKYVLIDGQEKADTYSSRPGHSEHQTGLCFDLNSVDDSFADTDEGKWVAANCYKYGFIIRYPEGKEDKTGYQYESWHLRYVGKDIAAEIFNKKICLEEYLGVTSEYNDSDLTGTSDIITTTVPDISSSFSYTDDTAYTTKSGSQNYLTD